MGDRLNLRVSHAGGPGAWVGLIKRGREVVWTCPHRHQNRDSDAAHTAARACASYVLDALVDPGKTRQTIEAMCRGAPYFQYSWQAKRWQWTIERYRWALETADKLRAEVTP